MTKGGTQFKLPLDQKVSRVFPLNEGILIEFHVRHELKFTGTIHSYYCTKVTLIRCFNYVKIIKRKK